MNPPRPEPGAAPVPARVPAPSSVRRPARVTARCLARDRRGVAALEMALLAPMLMLMTLALADVVDFLRVSLRLERTAGEVTNIVAQYETLRAADFPAIFGIAQRIAGSLEVTGSAGAGAGAVIVTGVANTGSGAGVLWRCRSGSAAFTSALRTQGTRVSIGDNVADATLSTGQGAVVTEVFLPRDTWAFSRDVWTMVRGAPAPPVQRLSAFAMQRPRLTGVLRVEPQC